MQLDSIDQITALDSTNVLKSIEQLGSQVQAIWERVQSPIITPEQQQKYRTAKHIVVCGMGGSILGTDIIQSLFSDALPSPITIVPDYSLPSFVDEQTLVIASSYSGGTAETWSAIQAAEQRGAMIAGITSGGKIGEFLQAKHYPHIIFSTEFNPAQIAKMGLGYSIFSQMALFAQLGLLTMTQADVEHILQAIAQAHLQFSVQVAQDQNPAKLLAYELIDRMPILMVAEHLEGAAHVFTNQLNENAKTLAEYHVIPELNHHLLEGFARPTTIKEQLTFITIHSDLYLDDNSRRLAVTETLLEKNDFHFTQYRLTQTSKLGQVFELIVLGAYTAFYTAMLYQLDPGPIPTVDWFKQTLEA